jgi:hypothetical protein
MTRKRVICGSLIVIFSVSLLMAAVQFLAAMNGGAGDVGQAMIATGHPSVGRALVSLNRLTWLRQADHLWQHGLNAPRNRLFTALGLLGDPSFVNIWDSTERRGWSGVLIRSGLLACGTVVVYWPVMLLLLIGTEWTRRRFRHGPTLPAHGEAKS